MPSDEDWEWLTKAENFVGYEPPQIEKIIDDDVPQWIIRRFEFQARKEGLTYYEYLDKYDPSFDPDDWEDAGSAFEAWA